MRRHLSFALREQTRPDLFPSAMKLCKDDISDEEYVSCAHSTTTSACPCGAVSLHCRPSIGAGATEPAPMTPRWNGRASPEPQAVLGPRCCVGRLWNQLTDSLSLMFGGRTTSEKPDNKFATYSHLTTKKNVLRPGSTSAWAKAYVRLSDIVMKEEITPTSVFAAMIAMGGIETFVLNFVLGFLAFGSLCARTNKKAGADSDEHAM